MSFKLCSTDCHILFVLVYIIDANIHLSIYDA